MKKILFYFILIFGVFTFLICAQDEQLLQQVKPQQSENIKLLTILHTNDLHGIFTEEEFYMIKKEHITAGFIKIAEEIEKVRSEFKNVILLDAGDTIHGTPLMFLHKGEPIIKVMNEIKYDAWTVGNHEFDWGKDVLEQRIKEAQFPVLGANILDKDGNVWNGLQPYIIKIIDNIRVGIIGISTTDTVIYEWPPLIEGLIFSEPIETTQKYVKTIRNECDLLVVLSHLGLNKDIELAEKVKGIDIIIGGHTHNVIENPIKTNNTIILQAGSHGRYLGRVDILFKVENNKLKLSSINGVDGALWETIPQISEKQFPNSMLISPAALTLTQISNSFVNLKERFPAEKIYRIYKSYYEQVLEKLKTEIGKAIIELSGEESAVKETKLGNLLADILREEMNTDISWIDATTIYGKIKEGIIREEELFKILSFYTSQNVVIVKVKGEVVKKAIEHSVSGWKFKKILLQISGMSFKFNPKKPVGERVGEIKIGHKPLDENKYYTLSTTAHLINGGTGFEMLKSTEIVKDTLLTLREIIIEGIKKRFYFWSFIEDRISEDSIF